MAKEIFTRIEETILCGSNWATETMTVGARLRFFRDTGQWPGLHTIEATEMFMQADIDAERAQGKHYCAQRKLARAKEAGLNIVYEDHQLAK